MLHSRSFRPGLFATLALVATAGRAMDLPALVNRADAAVGATVYLVPPMALFRASLDEARMQSAACRFTTTDVTAVNALLALLKGSGLHDNPVYQKPDLREGLYLKLTDGTQLKLLLEDNAGSRLPVVGIAETSSGGNLQSVAVSARATLAGDVRSWAATYGGTRSGSACDRLVPASIAPDTTRVP